MRKSLKIKAVFLFLAWTMIFAHGIIPHNHIDADIFAGTGCLHNHHDGGNMPEFRELSRDTEPCSISNILFQKFGSDDNSLLPEYSVSPDPFFPAGKFIPTSKSQKPSGVLPNTVLLRAPPLA